MAYINTETNQIGTLYQLLPNVSSPIKLSEEELTGLNIKKYVKPVVEEEFIVEEYIAKKIEISGVECQNYIYNKYPIWKQTSALAGIYGEEVKQEITAWCKVKIDCFNAWESHLLTLTTKEDIDACNFIQREYDDETMELISESFWGE